MSSGGYRPGAGRKFGSKDKKLRGKTPKATQPLPLNQADKDKINALLAIDLETREKARAYSDLLTRASKGESLTALVFPLPHPLPLSCVVWVIFHSDYS